MNTLIRSVIANATPGFTDGQRRVLIALKQAGCAVTVSELAGLSGLRSRTIRNYLTAFRNNGLVIVNDSDCPITVSMATEFAEGALEPPVSFSESLDFQADSLRSITEKTAALEERIRELESALLGFHPLCENPSCPDCQAAKEHIIDEAVRSLVRAADWQCEHALADQFAQMYGEWVAAGRPMEGYALCFFDPAVMGGLNRAQ